jgi:prepilin signal peptidase PulO-like enzyme (type II secretory pathway)
MIPGRTLLLVIAAVALGWLAGGLVNYLADVLPQTRRLSAIQCPQCTTRWSGLEFLRLSRCRACGTARTRRSWVVQISAALGVPALLLFPPPALGFWIGLAVFVYLAVVFTIDVEHRAILHEVSLVGAILAIPFGIWLNGWQSTLAGAAAGFGVMLALYYFGILFNRWMARRRGQEIEEDALGFGDVLLSGILGIALGWPRIIVCLFTAIVLGGLLSGLFILVMSLRRRYQAFTAIPYAPFLVIAAVILIYMA